MPDISIHQLAEITDGQLTFGSLPPLGGGLEPVGRIVPHCQQVAAGDVFWSLSGNGTDDPYEAALESMIRSAQGYVVSGHCHEPWAGSFGIHVEDTTTALLQLATWVRQRTLATRIGFVADTHNSRTINLVHELLATQLAGSCQSSRPETLTDLALGILDWHANDDFALADLGKQQDEKIVEISHLCCPEIIAINSSHKITHHHVLRDRKAFAEIQQRFFDTLPRDTTIIVNGDDPVMREVKKTSHLKTIYFGRCSDANVMATNVRCQHGMLTFDVEGTEFQFPRQRRGQLAESLTAITIGRLMSIPLKSLQAAALNQKSLQFEEITRTRVKRTINHQKSCRQRRFCGKSMQPSLLGWSDMLADHGGFWVNRHSERFAIGLTLSTGAAISRSGAREQRSGAGQMPAPLFSFDDDE